MTKNIDWHKITQKTWIDTKWQKMLENGIKWQKIWIDTKLHTQKKGWHKITQKMLLKSTVTTKKKQKTLTKLKIQNKKKN